MENDNITEGSIFIKSISNVFNAIPATEVFKKGEYLIREGEIEKSLYYIDKGAVKVSYLTELDEHIIRLGYDGSFLNSLSSFIKEEPSELYIEALKETTVKRISKEAFLEIVLRDGHSLSQYSVFLETLLMQQLDREIDLLLTSPVERLNRVLKRSPHLFQHIPLKYIASYLRMKPETLSRIRNY